MSQVDAIRNEDDPTVETSTVTPFPDLSDRQGTARTSILVFTRDPTLIDTVRKASPRDATVIHTPDLDQVSDQLASVHPDAVILDAASTADIAGLALQIARQFPDLVLIVAGRREESANLMKLTASGQIYRFLLVPLALGQTRLTIEAALRRHVERTMDSVRAPDAAATATLSGPDSKVKIAAGIGLLLLAGVAGWFLSGTGSDDTSTNGAPTSAAQGPASQPTTAPSAGQSELMLAAAAMERQHYVEPAGNNALEHYRAALAIEPGNAEAAAGLQAVADRLAERAEMALLAERLDQAVAAVEAVRNVFPEHARLTFLEAQLQRERERLQLTQARDVSVKLKSTLQLFGQRMESGRLVTPSGQSARDALFEARRIDATDPAVIQGFRDLTTRLVNEAERALTAGQRDQAAALAAAAREISPSDARIAVLDRSIADQIPAPAPAPAQPARATAAQPAAIDRLALGRARLADGRLIEPGGDSARDHLMAARVANPTDAEAQRLLSELKDRLINDGRQAIGQEDFAAAEKALVAAAALGIRASDDALASVQRDLESRRADSEFRRNIISAGSLERTRTVSAVYPENARRRGVTGWVDLSFTVTASGEVTDVMVMGAEPVGVFDAAAMRAVGGWRFKPVERAGSPVPQRAAARIRFDIEN